MRSGAPGCPLCRADAEAFHQHADGRCYFRCPRCALIFLDPEQRVSAAAAAARYAEHCRDPDEGYTTFLRRLADPLMARLPPGARGLDFGSGPAPVLSRLLTASGFPCARYDPLFEPGDAILESRFDFVSCTEVVEHLPDPGETFELFHRLLLPGGRLGVMTRFYGEAPFDRWWYRRDITHICFFAEPTMRWIAQHHGWHIEYLADHVVVFRVPEVLSG